MTDERITAYLLGELPDEESERFEDECFAGENWPEQISLAEDDLINAYLRRELTPEQRQHFERNYLTTETRKKRVAIAAALLTHIDSLGTEKVSVPEPEEPTWFNRFAAFWHSQGWAARAGLAVGVLALLTGAFWVFRSHTLPPGGLATLTLTMTAENRRDEGIKPDRVRLPPEVGTLRISLGLPDGVAPAARYRVELVNDEGEARVLGVVGQDAGSLSVDIPAAQLTRGQYALRLFVINSEGVERRLSGSYFFIVE